MPIAVQAISTLPFTSTRILCAFMDADEIAVKLNE